MRGPVALRSLSSYAGPSALLAALTTTATAGVGLGAAAANDDGHGRAAVVLPLLLLCLVAVPVPATELARRRRSATTLARLRGAGEARLWTTTAGPGLVAVLAGGALGVVAVLAADPLLPDAWPPTATGSTSAWLAWSVATVLLAATLAAVSGRLVGRVPLASALRPAVRAPSTGYPAVAGVVGLVAALVASAAAGYLARTTEDPARSGALVLAGSGLVALAVGELAVRLLVRTSRLVGVGLPVGLPVGVVVGARRAGARRESGRLRAVVAAGVVVVASLSATQAAGAWADRSDRVRLGAPLQVALPGTGAVEALRLTRRLDPDGRWLMAGAVSDARAGAERRVAWLDLERWPRVAGDFLGGTPAALGDELDALRDATPFTLVVGDRLTLGTARSRATVEVDYLGSDGFAATATLDPGGGTRATTPVACAAGCVVISVAASRAVEVTALRLGRTDLLAGGWVASGSTAPTVAPSTSGRLALGEDPLVPAAATAPVPVLTAGSPRWDGPPRVPGVGGGDRAAARVGDREALPLVGASGLLADLPVALAGSGAQGTSVRTLVLARHDTPEPLLAALADADADAPRSVGDPAATLGPGPAAERRARQVAAIAAGGMGLLVLLTGSRRRRREARREWAALRLVGLRRRHLRTAAAVESTALGAVVAVAVAVGGLVASLTVMAGAGLVPTGSALLDLGPVVSPSALLVGAVGAGFVTACAALVGFAHRRRGIAPSLLVEPDGPDA